MTTSDHFIQETTIDGKDYSDADLTGYVFKQVVFKNCIFFKTLLDQASLYDCTFINCNLSLVSFKKARLQAVIFDTCKLVGIKFYECEKFLATFTFRSSHLRLCDFKTLSLIKTSFKDSVVQDVAFERNDLRSADFAGVDFQGTTFEHCKLANADFRTAKNYMIDPTVNSLKKARFSLPEVLNLLKCLDIDIS